MSSPAAVTLNGPTLAVGDGVTIDCRYIDRVELASGFAVPPGLRLLLSLEGVELSLEFPGTRAEAEDLIVAMAPYTRAAPITNDIDYADVEDLRDSIHEGTYHPSPLVSVFGEPVEVVDGAVVVGNLGWSVEVVLNAASRGERLSLPTDVTFPAAVFALVVASAEPPALEPLNRRLAEFRESRRKRNPS